MERQTLKERLNEAEKLVSIAYDVYKETRTKEAWEAFLEAGETHAALMHAYKKRRRR